MPKYYVSAPVQASVGMEIEAENTEEAEEKFFETVSPSLCRQCSHEVELGDMDCENVSVEEVN